MFFSSIIIMITISACFIALIFLLLIVEQALFVLFVGKCAELLYIAASEKCDTVSH